MTQGLIAGLGRAAAWAGVLSLDITGFGPWMFSQPLVAGPVFGWLMGQVQVGVIVGGIVQLMWMDVTPVGVGIPFDTTAVTVLAVYWASLQPNCPMSRLVMALILAAPFGYAFCFMDSRARRVNTWIAHRIEQVSDARLSWALNIGIGVGVGWSWVRYTVFYALTMAVGEKTLSFLQRFPLPPWVEQGLIFAAFLFPIAGLGVALELFLTDDPDRRYLTLRMFKPKGL